MVDVTYTRVTRGQRDVRALSFELSKMSPQVGLALQVTYTRVIVDVTMVEVTSTRV